MQKGCGAEFGGAGISIGVKRSWPIWALLLAVCLTFAAPAFAADLDPLVPTASIDPSPNPAVTDQMVSFDGTGSFDLDGTVDKYEWDLDGNGSYETDTGSTASAATSYGDPQTITVRLRVTDNDGKTGESEASLTINDPPTAGFNFTPSDPTTDETISFHSTSSDLDGTIESYAWDFDNDGTTDATGSDPTHAYDHAGTFQVRLTVTDDDGLTGVVTKAVPVSNKVPVAAFHYSPSLPATNEDVTFTSDSSDPDGSIDSTLWDFDNDGEYDDGSGTSVQWKFTKSGSNTVRLKVIDNDGAEDTASQSVTVSNQAPTLVDFTASPSSPLTGEDVTFTAQVEDADSSSFSYAWDLDGNGSFETSGSGTPKRQYAAPLPVVVTLRVTDDGGNQKTASHQIVIGNRPPDNVDFTFSPSLFQTLDEVTFTSTATDSDGTLTYEWDFNGDNVFESSGRTARFTFGTPGPHLVRHRVTDDSGASKTVEQTVTPGNRSPTAGFNFTPSSPQTLTPVNFTSTSSDPDGPLASQLWDLNGNGVYGEPGVDASGPTASRQFPVAGNYTIGLRVTDGTGSTNVITRTVTVANRAPVASFSSPAAPRTLEDVLFSSTSTDPEGLPLTVAWDLDNNNVYEESGPTATRRFTTSGNYTIRIRVTDASGAMATATRSIAIANRPPAASFTQSPAFPRAFETVTFTSTSGDVDGTVASQAWDLDNDGSFDDGTTAKVTKKFTESRSFTVRLRAVDNRGAESIVAQTVVVGNRPPTASFSYLPSQPVAGQAVNFFSTASDPDSPIVSQLWDLDGNGSYNDASGPSAARAYGVGSPVVSLLVTDSEGDSSFVSQALNVTSPPANVSGQGASSRFLSPFPIVRISGTIRGRGTRLRRLTVSAPPGSTVTVNCRGKGCPFGRQSRVVKSGRSKRAVTIVRIRRFESRMLRTGTIIKLFITKANTIGKYTRFKIRTRKPPARTDRCLLGGSRKPVNCPTS
jgi:PKD repeat protein